MTPAPAFLQAATGLAAALIGAGVCLCAVAADPALADAGLAVAGAVRAEEGSGYGWPESSAIIASVVRQRA